MASCSWCCSSSPLATTRFQSRATSLPLLVLLLSLALTPAPFPTRSDALILGLRKRNGGSGGNQWPGTGGIGVGNHTGCNMFVGSWVRADNYPLYQARCPAIDAQFNCQLFGRPDTDYQRFRWKPNGCDLPRFDGMEFLVRMRGKTIMFVGDSLGRNQWESLICMLSASAPAGSPTQLTRAEPLSKFYFLEYGLSIHFYKAPYLVDIVVEQGGQRVLRLNEISGNAAAWRGADILSFNSGHWWVHTGAMQGWNYMRDAAGGLYADMDRQVAFEKGLTTWANWVDANVDTSKTKVFFQSISPTHYNPSEWSDPVSKNCYGERVPVSGWSTTQGAYADPNQQMRVVRTVLGAMRKPPYLLDITALSGLRKDGHPSVYSGDLSPEQRANPASADCSHWCLPGLPDTWNQLFYTALFFTPT